MGSERLQSQPSERSQLLVPLARLRRQVLAPALEPVLEHLQLLALVQIRAAVKWKMRQEIGWRTQMRR